MAWNACLWWWHGGELCMLWAIYQHLVADSGGHTGGGRRSWIYYTLARSHNTTIFLSWKGMSDHVFSDQEEETWNEICQQSLACGHYISLVCLEIQRQQWGNRCNVWCQCQCWWWWCQCLQRWQYSGSGSVDDKSQGSRSVIRSVDPVESEHPSMTWHHFIITNRPSHASNTSPDRERRYNQTSCRRQPALEMDLDVPSQAVEHQLQSQHI